MEVGIEVRVRVWVRVSIGVNARFDRQVRAWLAWVLALGLGVG